jgi:phage-related protein
MVVLHRLPVARPGQYTYGKFMSTVGSTIPVVVKVLVHFAPAIAQLMKTSPTFVSVLVQVMPPPGQLIIEY